MTSPSLCDMPEVVMKKLMEDLDFIAILTLRKVCQTIRNFIDDVKPDLKMHRIILTPHPKETAYVISWTQPAHGLLYQKHENGCIVKFEKREKLLENSNFQEIFLHDLRLILSFQKSILPLFFVSFRNNIEIFEKILEILKSMKLKVKQLLINSEGRSQIQSILGEMDSKVLEAIRIDTYDTSLADIDFLVEMDQWKNAKNMTLYANLPLDIPCFHFGHFVKTELMFQSMNLEKILEFKKQATVSPNLESLSLFYKNRFEETEQLKELFGRSSGSRYTGLQYYFKTTNPEKVLKLEVNTKYQTIHLKMISKESVPENGRVQE